MHKRQSSTSPQKVKAAERRRQAVALRLSGATYQQIGDKLGVTSSAAHLQVKQELETRAKQSEGKIVELRQIELARVDRVLLAIWDKVLKSDYKAIDKFVKLSERRAKLLGLDAPVQHKVEQHNIIEYIEGMSDEELTKQIERLEGTCSIVASQERTD